MAAEIYKFGTAGILVLQVSSCLNESVRIVYVKEPIASLGVDFVSSITNYKLL
jgi:hypothetical protein